MKIKQKPEDFIVEEIPDIDLSRKEKAHKIFILEKKNIDTFEAVRLLSSHLHVPLHEIGYAGLKDKHALTKQYISIPTHYDIQPISFDNIRINFVGYQNKKIKIGDLKANRFSITVRDIKQKKLDIVYEKAKTVSIFGVPNYFDSQRFGSVFHNDFIAKHVMKKEYENAVKIFLTKYLKSEKKQVKDEKRNILKHWSNLENVSVRNKVFSRVVQEYLKNRNWLDAYRQIPPYLREMQINAYQSYLWNECVKEILRTCVNGRKLYSVDYVIGSLYLYKDLSDDELKKIPSMFPTLSEKIKLSDFDKKIATKILNNERITIQEFEIESETGNFFKTRKRQVIIIPEDFSISDPLDDELNMINGKPQTKVTISFCLPKGSYATLITKQIFGH